MSEESNKKLWMVIAGAVGLIGAAVVYHYITEG
jgi:hypothetical protein